MTRAHWVGIWMSLLLSSHPSPIAAGDTLCENAVTQRQINACMKSERDRVEVGLTRAYDESKKGLSAKELTALEKAQRSWLQYRKLNCAFEMALYEDGTMAPAIQLGCEAKLASDRAKELRRIYDASRR